MESSLNLPNPPNIRAKPGVPKACSAEPPRLTQSLLHLMPLIGHSTELEKRLVTWTQKERMWIACLPPPAAQHKERIRPAITSPGKDQNSNSKEGFLLNMHRHGTLGMWKNEKLDGCKSSHRQLGRSVLAGRPTAHREGPSYTLAEWLTGFSRPLRSPLCPAHSWPWRKPVTLPRGSLQFWEMLRALGAPCTSSATLPIPGVPVPLP